MQEFTFIAVITDKFKVQVFRVMVFVNLHFFHFGFLFPAQVKPIKRDNRNQESKEIIGIDEVINNMNTKIGQRNDPQAQQSYGSQKINTFQAFPSFFFFTSVTLC